MRILARSEALDVVSEDYCTQVAGDLWLCGLDYMLVKGYVLGSIADYVFGFVGEYIPILNVGCGKHVMYYGVVKILARPEFFVEGWRRAEMLDLDIAYSCIEDVMEFYEVEEFVFRKVPVSVFGFGSWELYRILVSLLKGKSLYMLHYFY